MKLISKIILLFIFFYASPSLVLAQELQALTKDIQAMAKAETPEKAIGMMKNIVNSYKLEVTQNSESFDSMNGIIAMSYLKNGAYSNFETYIALIRNKFNQTSYYNMATATLVGMNKDLPEALELSKKTLSLYFSIKDDPKAKPEDFNTDDWKRYMDFAYYPYHDTHAQVLYAMGDYQSALAYQQKSFLGKPEDGIPSATERYTKLLSLNGQTDSAKTILLNMAKLGKLNAGMTSQFKTIYLAQGGEESKFEAYLGNLQNHVKDELGQILRKKMLDSTAPVFTLTDLNGKRVSLSDFKGKVVVLDLWATWCVPCLASFPAMQKLVKKHTDVVFLFIAVEEKEPNALTRVQNFIKKSKYNFHVVMDEPTAKGAKTYKILSTYQPNGIPSKYVIDKKGKLRFQSAGFSTDAELINEVETMIDIAKDL